MKHDEKNSCHEKEEFVIEGTVRWPNQEPVPHALVRAFDRDLRSEQLLGETHTDEQGAYRIAYTRARFRPTEKRRAGLFGYNLGRVDAIQLPHS